MIEFYWNRYYKNIYIISYFFVFIHLFAGCITADSILKKIDYSTSEEKSENIEKLTKLACDLNLKPQLRCFALKSLGILKEANVNKIGEMLLYENNSDVLIWGVWALGRINSEFSNGYLIKILEKTDSSDIGYYIIEALLHKLPLILADEDLSFTTTFALNKYRSVLKDNLPSNFSLLFNQVKTIGFLNKVLQEEIKSDNFEKSRKNSKLMRVYTALYQLFDYLEINKNRLLTDFTFRKNQLKNVYENIFYSLKVQNYLISNFIYWSLGNIADNKEFAELFTNNSNIKPENENDLFRMIYLWSFSNMKLYSLEAKKSLYKIILFEKNKNIISLLSNLTLSNKGPDEIQKIYNIEPNQ